MFEYLKGQLVELTPEKAILDVQGLGYKILIPLSVYSDLLGNIGKTALLYISPVIREDSHRLFGFISKSQRDLFERVCDVSGIGPKIALSLIGHMKEDELYFAIHNQDVKSISKVPGFGKKTAERLIVEMKDKLNKLKLIDESLKSDNAMDKALIQDALSALMNLGYQYNTAQQAIQKALKDSEGSSHLPELITSALRNI